MSVADKFKGQKEKLNNLCAEHGLLCTLSLYTSPVTLTIKPQQDMYEQLSMLEQADKNGEKRISPDAYKTFYSRDGEYATKTFGSFYMPVELERKFLNIFKKLDAFWKHFWHQETIESHAIRKGLMPVIEEDGGEAESASSNTEEVMPDDDAGIDAETLDSGEFEEDDEGPNDGEEDDSLIRQATFIVRNENACSTALLQRRLKLGYAKALHLVDLLEQRGIVGPYQGGGSREVLPYDQPEDEEVSADARATGT